MAPTGEMMNRLGLLFQHSRNSSPSGTASRTATMMSGHSQDSGSGSIDANVASSPNTSPVSTLTGPQLFQNYF